MRVLFVYKFLTLGGVESVLRARLEGLGAEGIEAQAWFLSDGGAYETFRDLRDRVRVGPIPALVDHVRSFDPQIVSSIDTEEALGIGGALGHSPLLVVECHTPYIQNQSYLARLDRRTVRAVLVPSEYQRRVVLSRAPGGIPVRVVPNPVDRSFLDAGDEYTNAAGVPVVAWVGRLDSLKNWEEYLEIAGFLHRAGLEARFWVIGDSREPGVPERLYTRAKEKGVLPDLSWLRDVRYTDMPRLFATVRTSGGLVVSTSRDESFGMAIAEAMASGCAVVAPRLGPFPEFITDGVEGRLYRPRSASHAAEVVLGLLADTEARARLGVSARQRILGSHATLKAMGILADALTDVAKLAEAGESPDHPAMTVEVEAEVRGSTPAPAPLEGLTAHSSGKARPNPSRGDAEDRKALFSGYYASGYWPGSGSSLEYTENIRKAIPILLWRLGIRTILDAPCGDYGWFRPIARDVDLTYIGGDIVDELIATHQKKFGSARTRFEVIDITCDMLPKVDLWLCRDCLFHFSNADISLTLDNFLRSEIPLLLTTTHPECEQNTDIPTGSFRLLNLELPPFSFPEPIDRVDDWIAGHPVRALALWERTSIARALTSGMAKV